MKRHLIRLLLVCFPSAWRRRYGDEFTVLLEQAPFSTTQVLDALRSGLDARWRQWTRGPLRGWLGEDERRFWRRWVATLASVGSLVALVYHLVPASLTAMARYDTSSMLWYRPLLSIPLFGLVAIGIGIAEFRMLRAILPSISRWWIGATALGPVVALMVMTTDRDYRLLPDLWSMTNDFLGYLGMVSDPARYRRPGFNNLIAFLMPTIYLSGLAAATQAYALKGLVGRAGWWVGIAILAAIAGLAAAWLIAPLRIHSYGQMPEQVRFNLWALDFGITALQFGSACAAYGIVSGLGLIALRRARQTAHEPDATAA